MPSRQEQIELQKISRRIARLRKAKGYSQERLGAESGLSPAHIGHLEQGRRQPSPLTLLRLGKGLGVPPTAFFTD